MLLNAETGTRYSSQCPFYTPGLRPKNDAQYELIKMTCL